ncbi:T9SS type A sorting domain-containing protein [Polluticoccus soli]|uniref:T9SS type A sorting domain-containing protein n=1 Tax=Polluticoccus soli TaxID=3034150 RepID=UPI0023E32602|nr:T9SS type A sorting domain-containing protein [Flavipsychrobacter sp. JY13-12]
MRLPYVLLLLVVAITAKAQNHVSNCSFEQYTTCPTAISQLNNCVSWRQYTTGTSDYFHDCNASMIPVVLQGWQNPAHGDAFIGFYLFSTFGTSIYKEYAATTITPLTIGGVYEVSMSVSLANNSGYACNDLGVWFYDSGPTTVSTATALSVTPQVSYASYGAITDTQNWVRVTKTFVADSAYDNIVIGGFKSWAQLGGNDTVKVGASQLSYYYIDSIVIRLTDTLSFIYNDTTLCVGDSVKVPFSAASSYFSPTNVFSLQLSDATGGFGSPITIATLAGNNPGTLKGVVPTGLTPGTGYRLRIVSSSPVMTVVSTKNIAIGLSQPAKPVAGGNSPVCGGSALYLTATTTTSAVTWQWQGPAGFSSTMQNPIVGAFAPANAGSYVVTALNYGCEAKDTVTIAYQPGITPITATNNGPVCVGTGFSLSTTASTTGATYSWSGPNSYTSTQQNPSISSSTLVMSGDYIVTASLNGCTVKDTTTVLVKPVPVATASNNGPVCQGTTLDLVGNSNLTGSTFSWIGPSYSANTQSPSIFNATPANQGTYTLTVTKDGCNSLPVTTQAVVNPIAPITATNNGPVCEGGGFTLSTTASTVGATYSWSGPNGYNSPIQNPSIPSSTLIMSGDYIVTASLNGCTTADTTTVLVKPVPVASASNSTPVCENGTLNLTGGSSISGSAFAWSGPLGYSSTLQSPTIFTATPGNTGNYTLIATKDGCNSLPAVTTVIVYPIPATPVANANSIMCDGSPLNLSTATVSNASYSWTGPNGFTSTLQNPSINPATFVHAGYYAVRISVNGCQSAKDSVLVTVNIIPKIGAWASPNDTICEGTLTTYVAIHSNGGVNPTFQWYKNFAPIAGANGLVYSTATLKTGDKFYCTMYSVGVCTDPVTVSTDTISMVVLPIVTQPSATISSVPAIPQPDRLVTFTAHVQNGGPNPKYQWQLNGTNQLGAINATWSAYTLKPFDKVNVLITSDDPCALTKTASSDTITLGFATSVGNIGNAAAFNVYPNPNDGNFRITAYNVSGQSVKLELLNAVGQLVYQETISAVNRQIDQAVRLQNIASGVYLLKLYDNGSVNTIKLNIR